MKIILLLFAAFVGFGLLLQETFRVRETPETVILREPVDQKIWNIASPIIPMS